jgi:imidazolonepropionase-like amidohydrolase
MRTSSLTLVVILTSSAVWGQAEFDSTGPGLAITHVSVIDATGAPAQPDQTVLVSEGRIVALGNGAGVSIPANAEIVDATGKFLIPGLWDMHAHIAAAERADAEEYLNLFLANGVTGVREMHSFFPDTIFALRKEIQAGKRTGPWIVAAGAMIDGPNPTAGGAMVAADAPQGRAAVQSLKQRGADFIKVHSKLPRDAYFAIADEAKTQGLALAGHVPESVSAQEASDAGQKSIEHLTGLWISCSSDEQGLRKQASGALNLAQPGDLVPLIQLWFKPLDSYSEPKALSLYQRFANNHTWQTPTLVLVRALCSLDDPRFTADRRVKYMPAFVRSYWDLKSPQNQAIMKSMADRKQSYVRSLDEVTKMHHAGVEFLAGTDTPFPFCFPGFGVHDELALLVQAGLTPMEALQSATRNPARYLERILDLGTVEKGKLADLILLDANPLDKIENTTRIAAVIVHGKLLSQETLRKMLADLEPAPSPNR